MKYIKNLKIDGQEILKSLKHTGFLGLILGMRNMVKLAGDLFSEGQMTFLLPDTLSQDHMETFFSCVPRVGRFCNNPTTIQYKSAHRKLLAHVSISVPLSANYLPKDDTLLISPDADRMRNSTGKSKSLENGIDISVSELDSIFGKIPNVYFSEYIGDVIGYISGSVVKVIK